jgi:hypothetical protein
MEEETSFDGVKIRWTDEAKKLLRTAESGYERRRAKARMEKLARVQGGGMVTKAVALEITGEQKAITATPSAGTGSDAAATMAWTPDAEQRLGRVPAGFMRDMTRTRIEDLAREKGATEVTLALAEEAIGQARQLMQETIGAYMQNTETARQNLRESVSGD